VRGWDARALHGLGCTLEGGAWVKGWDAHAPHGLGCTLAAAAAAAALGGGSWGAAGTRGGLRSQRPGGLAAHMAEARGGQAGRGAGLGPGAMVEMMARSPVRVRREWVRVSE